jgi:hypothetical protein
MHSKSTRKKCPLQEHLILERHLGLDFLLFRRRLAFRLDSLGCLLRLLRQLPCFALSLRLNTLLSSNSQQKNNSGA